MTTLPETQAPGRNYDDYKRLRAKLAEAMEHLATSYDGLGAGERASLLRESKKHLASDAFTLMVVGEFKRGKSTLINALLGDDILPAKVAPCTAVITEVKYGEVAKATLHHEDPAIPPLAVPITDLKKYVVIEADDEEEAAGALADSPYAHIEIDYPLSLCRNNVQIIDSPGLNEHRTRTKIALDYLSKSDALVLVLSCQQALSASELAFIDKDLGGRNLRHVFFVWNHCDAIAGSEADQAALRERSAQYLEPRIGTGERVFYLSARDGLVARKAGLDPTASGVPALEGALEKFLATERGRVKLLTPLRMAEAAIREGLAELLPAKESMLGQPLQELQARHEAERPRLEALERQRERTIREIERRRDALISAVQAAYQTFVTDVEPGLQAEVNGIPVNQWEAIVSQRRTQEAVAAQVQTWFEARVASWQHEVLEPLCAQHLRDMEAEVEERAREFVRDVDAVRAALSPELRVNATATASDVAPVDRILSAVGGFFLGGIGAAIEGAGFGFKGLSKGLVIHLGVAIGLMALGFGGSVILPVLAIIGVARSIFEANQLVQKLRDRVVIDVMAELRDKMPRVHREMGLRVTREFDGLTVAMDSAMKIMVDEVVGQVTAILAAKREGEVRLAQEQAALGRVRDELVGISRDLDTIRFEIEA